MIPRVPVRRRGYPSLKYEEARDAGDHPDLWFDTEAEEAAAFT